MEPAPPSDEYDDLPAPGYRKNPVRIACVQFDPKLGKPQENAAKVQHITSWLLPGTIDLLVLPEMALSGYIFTTPTSILPYLEVPRLGTTSLLARSLARRLRCHVIAGYPEALPSSSNDSGTDSSAVPGSSAESRNRGDVGTGELETELQKTDIASGSSRLQKDMQSTKDVEGEGLGVGWNSAMVVNPKGEVVGNYRKSLRFETDKNWAREGDGFRYFDLPEPLGRVVVGICMDMNPKDFVAPWDAFELATFCKDNHADMLVVPMNWLDPPAEPPEDVPPESTDPSSPSEHNLNYWAARLTPLHDPAPSYVSVPGTPIPGSTSSGSLGSGGMTRNGSKEVIFVACNRVGMEEGTRFVGTSCVMTISSDPSRIELVECCDKSEERVMIATIT